MNAYNESLSVTGAKISRSPHKSRRREDYDKQEINRQIGGWVGAFMNAGFSEDHARMLSKAVVYGPIVSIAIAGLTVGLR